MPAPTLRRRSAPPPTAAPELDIVTDKQLIDFVDRCGVAVHCSRTGEGRIAGWSAIMPHPDTLKASGTNWRQAVEHLLAGYKRRAEDTPV